MVYLPNKINRLGLRYRKLFKFPAEIFGIINFFFLFNENSLNVNCSVFLSRYLLFTVASEDIVFVP